MTTTNGPSSGSSDEGAGASGTGASGEPDRSPSRTIVGLGASAGGLEALQSFLEAVPADSTLSFVAVLHLAPDRESRLADLLQSASSVPVTQVTRTLAIEPRHVYVVPPGKQLTVQDTRLEIDDFDQPGNRRHAIDAFFESLAASPAAAAGIIVSGTGTDGAVGLKALKQQGGLVLVQDPDDATHAGMPRSAMDTGVVDAVLPAHEMATALPRMLRRVPALSDTPDTLGDDQARRFEQILDVVREATGHDISIYKRTTALRRIQRRMQIRQTDTLSAYLNDLYETPSEAQALFRELLVGVTRFFRNPEAFKALQDEVISRLFEDKDRDDTVRVWVVGCSTGEEAYSVAMLLKEYAAERTGAPRIQVFASDLNEDALQHAREGRYPASIETDVSDVRLRRFFNEEDDSYRVKRSLREAIIFAHHNILRDPPFSRLDLVSCRNLLIFLQREPQQRVFQTLHYALRPHGYLLLGQSETTGRDDLFRTAYQDPNIFRARERTRTLPPLPVLHGPPQDLSQASEPLTRLHEPSEASLHRASLEEAAPPSILVDEQHTVVHLSDRAGRYLQPSGGTLSNRLSELVRPELRSDLREALMQVFESGMPTVARPVQVSFNGRPCTVYLTVRRARWDAEKERLALVLFNEGEPQDAGPDRPSADAGRAHPASQLPPPDGLEAANDAPTDQLQDELRRTRARLRDTQRRFRTTREELQAQNEELRSMNEEYKSTTEELETSKEELQSVNEELQTVNEELEQKLEEVSQAHSDLENLVRATDVGTIFLDEGLQIQRFTPPVKTFFSIRDSDRGRPITELKNDLAYGTLQADAERVLDRLTPVQREVQTDAGDAWYIVRIRPYRTVDNVIEGVVLTFVDITEQKQAEQALREAKEYAESIVDTVRESLVVLDTELRVQSANESFYDTFEVDPENVEGQRIYDLGSGQWDLPELRTLLEEVLPNNDTFDDFQVTHDFEALGERTLLLNARRLDHVQYILLAIEDITEQEAAKRELHTVNRRLQERIAETRELASELTVAEQRERNRIAQVLHDDLQQLLYAVEGRVELAAQDLAAQDLDAEDRSEVAQSIQETREWIGRAIETTRQLTVDLSPPILGDENLADALEWLQNQMDELHGFVVELEGEQTRSFDKEVRTLLFQTVRELLFNAHKYAGVDAATVRLEEPAAADDEAALLLIHVIDEGCGFDVDATEMQANGGMGLHRAHERLRLLGGQLDIQSAPSEGTHITIHAPPRDASPQMQT